MITLVIINCKSNEFWEKIYNLNWITCSRPTLPLEIVEAVQEGE